MILFTLELYMYVEISMCGISKAVVPMLNSLLFPCLVQLAHLLSTVLAYSDILCTHFDVPLPIGHLNLIRFYCLSQKKMPNNAVTSQSSTVLIVLATMSTIEL